LGFRHGLDLQTLHNQGLVDVANINRMSDKEKAHISAEAQKYGHDMSAFNTALQHAGTTQKESINPDTGQKETSVSSNPLAAGLVPTIGQRVGMNARPVSQDVLSRHSAALAERQQAGGPAAVEGYLRSLSQTDPDSYTALRGGMTCNPGAVSQPPSPAVPQKVMQPAAPPSIGNMNAGTVSQRQKMKPLPGSMAWLLTNP
jgi:hypothetical protein